MFQHLFIPEVLSSLRIVNPEKLMYDDNTGRRQNTAKPSKSAVRETASRHHFHKLPKYSCFYIQKYFPVDLKKNKKPSLLQQQFLSTWGRFSPSSHTGALLILGRWALDSVDGLDTPPAPSLARRIWISEAMVRNDISTFSELLALVSRNGIFRDEARSCVCVRVGSRITKKSLSSALKRLQVHDWVRLSTVRAELKMKIVNH